MRKWPLVLVFLLAACGGDEEKSDDIVALAPAPGSRPVPIAEPPAPVVAESHLRPSTSVGSGSTADSRPSSGGGGAARSEGEWVPRHAPTPSAREVEQFRRRLEREVSARVDSNEDPCEQFEDVMRATAAAAGAKQPRRSSRATTRERCRQFSKTMQRCMEPSYFQRNTDECNAEFERLAKDSERERERARRAWEAIERAERAARRADEEGGG